MGLWHKVVRSFNEFKTAHNERKAQQEAELDEIALSIMKQCLEKESISCRCSGMAIPVWDTTNKYYCLKCGSRFANSKHNIVHEVSRYDVFKPSNPNSGTSFSEVMQAGAGARRNQRMEFYDRAIDELKEQYH